MKLNFYLLLIVSFTSLITGNLISQPIYGQEKVENVYFSINIPDNWTYVEYSNGMRLAPNEFTDVLQASLGDTEKTADEGVLSIFTTDTEYLLKNAPLESYAKYIIDKFGITNITSQSYATVGGEKAVRLSSNETVKFGNGNIVLYLIMHDKGPYQIAYLGTPKNIYEKYLPEFENIVNSFTFADSPSGNKNLSENNNVTDTKTNFSSAILDSERPYLGLVGISLTSDLSKNIGLNQNKGFLITSITKDSPADKYGLRGGSNTTTYKGRDIGVGGDVILKIDNRGVSKVDDIFKYIQNQKHVGDKVHITFLRDNAIKELDVILGSSPSTSSNDYSNTLSSQYGNDKNQEELYDECVGVAGKSLCDFLFKK